MKRSHSTDPTNRLYQRYLRNVLAPELLMGGCPLAEITHLLGHKSYATTERIYAPVLHLLTLLREGQI